MATLFKLPEPITKEKCKTCKAFDWVEYNDRRKIFYCRIRKSNRTHNGQLKIKANQTACQIYEKD